MHCTQELKVVLQSVPEIVELVGLVDANQVLHIRELDGEEKVKSVLRSTFTQLMTASKEKTAKAVSKLKNRLHNEIKVSGTILCYLMFKTQVLLDLCGIFINY